MMLLPTRSSVRVQATDIGYRVLLHGFVLAMAIAASAATLLR